jgi:hypothetical protein
MRPELEVLFGKFRVIARGTLAVVVLATLALIVIALVVPQLVGM